MRKSYGGKKIKSLRQLAREYNAKERARSRAENKVHLGPRGGKYRVVNGRKRYDVA